MNAAQAARGRFLPALALIAAFAAPGAAAAAAIYKWRDPGGGIGYSAVVPSHALVLERIESAAAPPAPPEEARAQGERRIADAAAAGLESRWARVESELRAAREDLQRAQARQAKGIEPEPGERLGTAGGTSRLAPAYWERRAALDRDVERARQRLEQALRARDALRG